MKKLNKTTIIMFLIIIFIFAIYKFFTHDEYIEFNSQDETISINNTFGEANSNIEQIKTEEELKDNDNKIVIYVTGAIKNKGVYELEENSRIADLIEKAGGLTEDANITNINLAYILQDGMKVHIPTNSEDVNEVKDDTEIFITNENESKESSKTSNSNSKVNINTATQTELETLPGIGVATALKIIDYRKENGKFNNIEDIKNVSGIGESKYSKIKDKIKV